MMPGSAASSGLLSLLDWVVVAAYTGCLIVLGLVMSRRRLAPVDYFLASRATRWPVIGLALAGIQHVVDGIGGIGRGRLCHRHFGL